MQDEVEEVAVPDPVLDNGDDIFEDAPETKQHEEEQIVIACSRFGCRVPDGFAKVVQCSNLLCNRMMHVECCKTMCRKNNIALIPSEK